MPRGRGGYPMEVPEGTQYGELAVIREVERSGQNRRFLCRCSCGAEVVKFLGNMRNGQSKSCGCTYVYGAAGRAARVANYRQRTQQTEEGRLCLLCNTWKPWSAFGVDKRMNRGRATRCFACNNLGSTLANFHISRADWDWLSEKQGGFCALCGEAEDRNSRLSIDHDHSCHGPGKGCRNCIRGLLCDTCNKMIGFAEKRVANRKRFLGYLESRPLLDRP